MGTMRLALLFVSALLALGQTAAAQTSSPKKAAPVAAPKNYKLSGSPSATVTLEIYTDYECPHCRRLYLESIPDVIAKYVNTGKVRILHRDFPLPGHQYSKLAARYANAAGQIGKYEAVVTQIFTTQTEWSGNGSLDAVVAKVLSPAEMVKVREMVKSDSHLDDGVAADYVEGQRDQLTETPTTMVVANGKREKISGFLPASILESYIDQKLGKK